MKPLYRIEERPENLVASFGEARLVQSLDGRFELRGGSQADRIEAQEWVSMFLQDVAVRQNGLGCQSVRGEGERVCWRRGSRGLCCRPSDSLPGN